MSTAVTPYHRELVRRVLPHGPGRSDLAGRRPDGTTIWAVISGAPHGYVFVATTSIPEIAIVEGAVVFVTHSVKLTRAERRWINGVLRWLPRRDFGSLLTNRAALQFVADSWNHSWDTAGARAWEKVEATHSYYLRRGARETPSCVLILPPLGVVSAPVRALSDDDAIAALLVDVGCRPMREED